MHTVLVIDDHIPTLDSLCIILRLKGYVALAAANAVLAEEYFRGNSIHLVIVDHGVPGVSGAVLAAQFKAIRAVPVLMMSGNPELLEKPSSVDALLAKPQSVENLLASIELLVGNTGTVPSA